MTMATRLTDVIAPVKVGILTPYLTETLETLQVSPENIPIQVMHGLDPDLSFRGLRRTYAGSIPVDIIGTASREERFGMIDQILERSRHRTIDFLIIGSTEAGEALVQRMMGTGIIVARYSLFYGGPSGYTGRLPQDSGYSIDIPKVVPAVQALLSFPPFMEGLLARDEKRIADSLEVLSRGRKPIVTTPYLREALKHPLEFI